MTPGQVMRDFGHILLQEKALGVPENNTSHLGPSKESQKEAALEGSLAGGMVGGGVPAWCPAQVHCLQALGPEQLRSLGRSLQKLSWARASPPPQLTALLSWENNILRPFCHSSPMTPHSVPRHHCFNKGLGSLLTKNLLGQKMQNLS